MIYLASPYSHKDPAVMEKRFKEACVIAASLMRKGYNVFSPIAHSHPIAQYQLPKTWEFWEQYDRFFIQMCHRVIVCDNMEGWQDSRGVGAEIAIANELGKEVIYYSEF